MSGARFSSDRLWAICSSSFPAREGRAISGHRTHRIVVLALAGILGVAAIELRRIRKHQAALNEMVLMGVNLDPVVEGASPR